MQSWLLEDIENGLAEKPFERVSWWGPKWIDFITVDSPLTVEHPLWLREESSLNSILLFNDPPDKLQAEIIQYWQQPSWKRWLLDLFTPIHRKIKLWSYYQRCLSFREVSIEHPLIATERIAFTSEQHIMRELTHRFNSSRIQFENYLEKHAGNSEWIQNNLGFLLSNFLWENWWFFSMATQSLSESNRDCRRNQLEEEYHQFEKTLHQYLFTWGKNTFNSFAETINTSNIDIFVYGYASVKKARNCSIHSIENWVKIQRQVIDSLLQEKSPEQFFRIKNLLEFCLSTLRFLVDPQLVHYENKMITEVLLRQFDCDTLIQHAETLQTDLTHFFQKTVLLFHFHPSFGDEALSKLQIELFKAFKELTKESLGKIKEGLHNLEDCVPQQPKHSHVPKFWKLKEGFTEKLKQKREEIDANTEQVQAEMDANFKKIRPEMETQQTRVETAEMDAKINETPVSPMCLLLKNKPFAKDLIQKENEVKKEGPAKWQYAYIK